SFLQAVAECRYPVNGIGSRGCIKETDHRYRRSLRLRSERPRRRSAADERDEVAPFQLIETNFEPSPLQRMKMSNITMMAPRPSTQLGISVPNIDVFWLTIP